MSADSKTGIPKQMAVSDSLVLVRSTAPVKEATLSSEDLLERFDRLMRTAIRKTCSQKGGIDYDDILQDARLRLLRSIEQEPDRQLAASYVYRIAVTTAIDALRRVQRRREDTGQGPGTTGEDGEAGPLTTVADGSPSPERRASSQAIRKALHSGLTSLKPNRRRAVQLYLKGFGSNEIADLLGWSEGKARNLLYRGLEQLRQHLRKEGVGNDWL